MKHLPNIITLANLFCGCIAIAFILNSQPFVNVINGEQYWISGTPQAYYGSIFIALAAIFDLLDGMAARWLGVYSPIGKDLDSLADVVSFGVAPAMIIFKMLWAAYMAKPHAIDVSMLYLAPAFLIACFGAYRLARFNNAVSSTSFFTGVPIPAIGLLVASFPIINLYNPLGVGTMMQNEWVLYGIILILCLLMISKLKLFTLKIQSLDLKKYWPQVIWLILTLALIPFLKSLSIPFSFLLYIILSLASKPSTT